MAEVGTVDRAQQLTQARELGRAHGMAGIRPYGDLDDCGSAVLMTALGETGPTTADNHPHRAALCEAYEVAWLSAGAVGVEAQCGECGETFNPNGTEDNPEHPEHYARADGRPCGGAGEITGAWR